MAHPRRADYVEELLASLDGPADVVWDEKNERWDTGRRALLAHKDHPEADFWCVLQDDSLVCRDFIAGATKAAEVVQDRPISFFYSKGTNVSHQRTTRLANQVELPTLLRFAGPWWGVAVMFPTPIIDRMVRIADQPRPTPAYDRRLSGALLKMGLDCYYVLPSLVDHRLDGPSMIEGREQDGRCAHHFIGEDASALDIDWKALPIVDGYPIVRGRRPQAIPGRTMVPRGRRRLVR